MVQFIVLWCQVTIYVLIETEFAQWPLSSKFSITFIHGNTFVKYQGLIFSLKKADKKLASPWKCPLWVNKKCHYCMRYICLQIHGSSLLYIILSTTFWGFCPYHWSYWFGTMWNYELLWLVKFTLCQQFV